MKVQSENSQHTLPAGVKHTKLTSHHDERGTFTEIYRESWVSDFKAIQWNAVRSEAGVLRGVHAHLKHYDYLTIVRGRALFGLHDLRQHSDTFQLSCFVELKAYELGSLIIPPGVAHGFYFLEPSIHIYAVSEYWDMADELGCHYLDPALNLDWPNKNAEISIRDQGLNDYSKLLHDVNNNE